MAFCMNLDRLFASWRRLPMLAALCVLAVTPSVLTTRAMALDAASFEVPAAAQALAMRIAGDDARTRVIIDFEGEVAHGIFLLPEPNRLVIELPGMEFSAMRGQRVDARGLVSALRYGPFAPGRGRVVMDLGGFVVVDEVLVLAALDGQPARLVVDLIESDAAGFADEVERTRAAFLASVEAPKEPAGHRRAFLRAAGCRDRSGAWRY
jgi:N-acetylmuramoyl-L-alanine amidase